MRGKSMVLIVIALGCGLVASIGISQIMDQNRGGGGAALETRKIYVTLVDVDIGETLTPQMIKLEAWPKDKIPKDALTEEGEVIGRRPRQRLFSGEPILKAKLIDSNELGGASERIPNGYRVQSVKVTMESAASNLILPGDRVDVLVYLRQGGEVSKTGTMTLLKDVRVFAVNEQINRDVDRDGNAISAKTVSLIVKPAEVEKLVLASRLGQISLSLRRPDDTGEDDTDRGTSVTDILAGGSSNEHDRPNNPQISSTSNNSDNPGFLNFLASQAQAATTTTQVATAPRQAWTLDILEPQGVTRYQFDAPDRLPYVVSGGSAGAGTASSAEPVIIPPVDPAPGTPAPDNSHPADGDTQQVSD